VSYFIFVLFLLLLQIYIQSYFKHKLYNLLQLWSYYSGLKSQYRWTAVSAVGRGPKKKWKIK